MTEVKIEKKRAKILGEGTPNEMEYFWYSALRLKDDVHLTFGSKNEYEVGETVEVDIQKFESASGGVILKEVQE